jgi:hypothetical protein
MKFTINGFSQEKLIEHGLDAQDALLLDWLSDLISSPKIKTVQHDGFIYYWIKYDAVLEDLPILTVKNTKGIGKKFLELEAKGLLVKRIVRDINGSFSYFRFTDAVHDMKRSESKTKRHCPEKSSATEQEKRHCPEKGDAHCPEKGNPLPPKEQSYNPPTIYPPTKDISNDISTRDKKKTRKVKEKFSIPADWMPSERCYELLAKSGVTKSFADSLLDEFIFYWEERGDSRPGWDATFLSHAKIQQEKQKNPASGVNRIPGSKQPMQFPDYSGLWEEQGNFIDSTAKVIN